MNLKKLIVYTVSVFSFDVCTGQTLSDKCDLLKAILHDPEVRQRCWSMKHTELPLIVNDRDFLFYGCTDSIDGRQLKITHDTSHYTVYDTRLKEDKSRKTIFVLREPGDKKLEFKVWDPMTNAYIRMAFRKVKGKYVALKHEVSHF